MNGEMPTTEGDVIIQRLTSYYRVWVVTRDGAQEPDPNVEPRTVVGREDAERLARDWTRETNGQIFRIEPDGTWSMAAD
jgi:hypothetical protein